jgi:lipid-binding SYLF domain-containing protein
MRNRVALSALLMGLALAFSTTYVHAQAREEGRLLMATEVLDEIRAQRDSSIPDRLLDRAYGIVVVPSVTKLAFIGGGRWGKGAMVVRDKDGRFTSPIFVTLAGASIGWQWGGTSTDIVLVFTTKAGIEGITGGKLTLGADASVATGPVGRQGSAATDIQFNAEIYSYARTRGLFGGIALDGSVISIDRSANADFYHKSGVTASEIFSGQAPTPPPTAQRFLERLAQATRTQVRGSPAPQADTPASAEAPPTNGTPPAAEPARTFPLDDPKKPTTP